MQEDGSMIWLGYDIAGSNLSTGLRDPLRGFLGII